MTPTESDPPSVRRRDEPVAGPLLSITPPAVRSDRKLLRPHSGYNHSPSRVGWTDPRGVPRGARGGRPGRPGRPGAPGGPGGAPGGPRGGPRGDPPKMAIFGDFGHFPGFGENRPFWGFLGLFNRIIGRKRGVFWGAPGGTLYRGVYPIDPPGPQKTRKSGGVPAVPTGRVIKYPPKMYTPGGPPRPGVPGGPPRGGGYGRGVPPGYRGIPGGNPGYPRRTLRASTTPTGNGGHLVNHGAKAGAILTPWAGWRGSRMSLPKPIPMGDALRASG